MKDCSPFIELQILLLVLFFTGNNSLRTSASPLLHDLMFGVHKSVRDPYRDESVFDRCKIEYQNKDDEKNHLIYPLGSGSDYFPFYKFMGIPSIDMSYSQSDLVNNLCYFNIFLTFEK